MNRPSTDVCRLVYAKIQAYCAVRASTLIGQKLRSKAGAYGDIASLPHESIVAMFKKPIHQNGAFRLVELVKMNSRKGRHNGQENGEAPDGKDSLPNY
jgi:hypothetical protein